MGRAAPPQLDTRGTKSLKLTMYFLLFYVYFVLVMQGYI